MLQLFSMLMWPRLVLIVLGAIAGLGIGVPVVAADHIFLVGQGLQLSLSVKELDTWLTTRQVEPDLAEYLELLSSAQQTQLRELLTTSYQDDFFNLSQMSQTSIGENFLRHLGEVIRVQGGQNGYENLRVALMKAEADPDGISVINLLRSAPQDLELDLAQMIGLFHQFLGLSRQTNRLVSDLKLATVDPDGDEPESQLDSSLNLQEPGRTPVSQQTLYLQVKKSAHLQAASPLTVDLYLPQQSSPASNPVIVISGGLGARRDSFASLAHHWASHGFAVVIPDHPGSNEQRRQDFAAGRHQTLFDATEYIHRPLEITAILDELERLNSARYQGQLNLQRVGIFSHSFGGPTALALAGAELNFAQLEQDCAVAAQNLLNISLMYQCEALQLPRQLPQLQDHRVKAIYLLSPFGSSLFGQTGIKAINLPVLWSATDIDLLAPLLVEQVPPFSWLETPDKYLAIAQGLHHGEITFEYLLDLIPKSTSLQTLKAIGRSYQKALGLAFFKTHVAEDDTYRGYLRSSYAQAISEAPHNLHLVHSYPLRKP